ncbi:MAG: DUF4349 domain-containing protein [Kofleriaceae bacterium]
MKGASAVYSSEGNGEAVVLASAPAERRRIATDMVDAVSGLFAGPAAPATAQVLTSATAAEPEKLVVEAWLTLRVDDVVATAAAIRARVEGSGGRVVSENIEGPTTDASSAAVELRVPPAQARPLQDWLASQGVIESRRTLASDVSKQLFDQELALTNLGLTMARLQKLAEKDSPMQELIQIENEMTRVRGEIEKIKGEQRWLLDRVAFATITLTVVREGGPVEFAPHARIHPGPHFATLTLLDPEGRQRTRYGGGITIHIKRFLTFDLDAFPARRNETRTVVGSVGGAMYSGLLGGGQRRFLNPYLGLRVGYGYLSGEYAAVLGGEIGLELFKHKYLQIGIAARAVAFLREEHTDVALQTQLGFEVPF